MVTVSSAAFNLAYSIKSPNRGMRPSGVNRSWVWRVAVLGCSGVYLYLRLFRSLHVPVLLSGDQVFFWTYGQRVAHGQLPYRDFSQITAPGADYLYAAAFRLFGESMWVTNLLVLLLGVALCYVAFACSRRFVAESVAAAIALAYLVLVFSHLLNGTHHVFAILAIGCGLLLLLRSQSHRHLFFAGIFFGIAALFTQTHGVVACLGATVVLLVDPQPTIRDRLKDCGALWTGAIAILLPIESCLASSVGVYKLWNSLVVIPSRLSGNSINSYSPFWFGTDGGSPLSYLYFVLIYAGAPSIVLLAARRVFKDKLRNKPACFVLAVCTLLFAEVTAAPNQLRILAMYLPVCVLFAYLLQPYRHAGGMSKLALLLITIVGIRAIWIAQRIPATLVDTPAGRIAISPTGAAAKLLWLQSHLQPNDAVLEAAYPGVYLPLHILSPVYADNVMPFRISTAEVDLQTIDELRSHHVRYVVWNEALDADPEPQVRSAFEAFRDYVLAQYRTVAFLPNGERILESRDSTWR